LAKWPRKAGTGHESAVGVLWRYSAGPLAGARSLGDRHVGGHGGHAAGLGVAPAYTVPMPRHEVEISGPIHAVDIRDAPGGVSEPRPYIHLEEVGAVDKDAAEVVGWNAWNTVPANGRLSPT